MPPGNVTELLSEYRGGKREALDLLVPLVYDELRRIAARYMRAEAASHTRPSRPIIELWLLTRVSQIRSLPQ